MQRQNKRQNEGEKDAEALTAKDIGDFLNMLTQDGREPRDLLPLSGTVCP